MIDQLRLLRTSASRVLRGLHRGQGAESGAVAIEFGFILPVMMLLIYGVFEVGRVLFIQAILLFAAEEATRYAIVNYEATLDEIRDVAASEFILIEPSAITVFDVTAPVDPNDQTRLVTVEIAYNYEPWMPFDFGPIQLVGSSRAFIVDE